ncbi:MAG: hypothetical protein ACK4MK_09325, partial [Tepidimonas ignava]
MRPERGWGIAALVGVLMIMGGCGAREDDLAQWMAQQRAQDTPKGEHVKAPSVFQPEQYTVS